MHENHVPLAHDDPERQPLREEVGDLTRREVHHREHEFPEQVRLLVVLHELGARALHPQRAEVDPQLVSWLLGLREVVDVDDPADADVDLEEVVVSDLGHLGTCVVNRFTNADEAASWIGASAIVWLPADKPLPLNGNRRPYLFAPQRQSALRSPPVGGVILAADLAALRRSSSTEEATHETSLSRGRVAIGSRTGSGLWRAADVPYRLAGAELFKRKFGEEARFRVQRQGERVPDRRRLPDRRRIG